MPPLPYTRPLIKISGEALGGEGGIGIDAPTLDAIASDVAEIAASGKQVALVVGGGNFFRGLSGAAAGMDRVKGDYIGMMATVMNALALEQALLRHGQKVRVYTGLPVPTVCESWHRDNAKADLSRGIVVVLAGGTGNPYFTTDTTAALRAAELGCDAILKATQVDGVYSADPKTDGNAKRFDRIRFSEVLARDLKVMDAAAIALARDNNIPIVVFSLSGKGSIGRTLRGESAFSVVEQ